MSNKNVSESEKIDRFLSNDKNIKEIIDITSRDFEELDTAEEKYNQKILEIVEIFSKHDVNISESRAKRIFEFVEKIKTEYNKNKILDDKLENISGGVTPQSSDEMMLGDTRFAIDVALTMIKY
ncbi:MAG: hypothetical protein IJC57_02320 [Clostridia bacterium]|nr:hypothetical protein [Clostridia bacterium]